MKTLLYSTISGQKLHRLCFLKGFGKTITCANNKSATLLLKLKRIQLMGCCCSLNFFRHLYMMKCGKVVKL